MRILEGNKGSGMGLFSTFLAYEITKYYRRSKRMKIIKFMMVGGGGALLGLTVLWLLTDLAGFHYLSSYALAFVVSVSNNYFWNSRWTFKGKQSNIKGYARYFVLSAATLGMNMLLMYLATDVIGLWYMMSAVIITGIVFLINFLGSRKYVWNRNIAG
jgi:putative flippase GtrA